MLKWIVGGVAALLGYEWYKSKGATSAAKGPAPSSTAQKAAAAGTSVPQLSLAKAASGLASALGGQLSVVQTGTAAPSSSLSDPIAIDASLAANALQHGVATDPSVQAAVRTFQSAVGGLTVDGKYGPMTQAALQKYVPNAPPAPAVYGGTG